MRIEQLAVPAGPAALALLPRLREALLGGRPIAPHPASGPEPLLPPHHESDLPADLAVVVGTSGSTGAPKRAMLSGAALVAAAELTHEHLGGPGQWLLPMPAHHIGGLQVLLRSEVAGTTPVLLDLHDGFTPRAFVEATRRLDPGQRHYTSMVPTQLRRLLDEPGVVDALSAFDAILVGGAALPPALRHRTDRHHLPVVPTYGMSETAGGCVYDGLPLPGTQIAFDDEARISLGGPTVGLGYLGDPVRTASHFGTDEDNTRWFRTDDVGHLDAQGRLHVDGRIDDLVNTGGLKVAPREVEEALLHYYEEDIRECVVVGVPDPHWGEAVCALLVLHPAARHRTLTVGDVRAGLRGILEDHALPQRVRTVEAIPYAAHGKPDRRAIRALLADPEGR